MRKELFGDKSNDPLKRIKVIERVVNRIAKRVHGKESKAMITPFPISNAMFGKDIKGSILKYMFPCEGIILNGYIRFDKKPKSEVMITANTFGQYNSDSKGYIVDRKISTIDMNLKVMPGDCFNIIIDHSNEEPFTEVWTSFLWEPTVKNIKVKSFLIDELENNTIEGD